MKRSPLTRKTPMARGTSTLKSTKPMNRGSGFNPKLQLVHSRPDDEEPAKPPKPPKARKPLKPTRPQASAAEKAHMGRVAALGCILCDHLGTPGTPAIVHHLRTGQGKKRASHYDTLPLCPPHHQHSGYGVHDMGRKQFEEKYGISEVSLLHRVQSRLGVPLWQQVHLPPPRLNCASAA